MASVCLCWRWTRRQRPRIFFLFGSFVSRLNEFVLKMSPVVFSLVSLFVFPAFSHFMLIIVKLFEESLKAESLGLLFQPNVCSALRLHAEQVSEWWLQTTPPCPTHASSLCRAGLRMHRGDYSRQWNMRLRFRKSWPQAGYKTQDYTNHLRLRFFFYSASSLQMWGWGRRNANVWQKLPAELESSQDNTR